MIRKIFENPQKYRDILFSKNPIHGGRNDFSGKSFICVSLTKFCPVGCSFFFLNRDLHLENPAEKTQCINKQNSNFNDKEKEYIFIITIEKTIIVVESSKNIRHTSISHGRSVLGSGALKINDGNLI